MDNQRPKRSSCVKQNVLSQPEYKMKTKAKQLSKPIEFIRADPKELAKFDPSTKRCVMNCGPHLQDPRSAKERKFLCTDCETAK